MTVLRSAMWLVWFAAVTAVLSISFLPALVLPRRVTLWMAGLWIRLSFWGLKAICGTRFEVRGAVPGSGALVAVKHMSMWDTMAIFHVLGDPAIVYKRSLGRIPFFGWYLIKAGMIAIDRDGGARALRDMSVKAKAAFAQGRSIVIFPEGTRKKPGAPPDYKPGVAALYSLLGVACVPVALNSGQFWTGPLGFLKKPGTIVMEFLEPIPPKVPRRAFMPLLQERIETAVAQLVAEGQNSNEARRPAYAGS